MVIMVLILVFKIGIRLLFGMLLDILQMDLLIVLMVLMVCIAQMEMRGNRII